MTALWTSQDAQAATGGESTQEWQASGLSIDTRTLQKGDLFVALKDVRDGHDFVAQALEKGAAAALVTHLPEGVSPDAPLLIVPDVLGALEDLARAARARTEAKVIAVTGSVGKTSTKEMLRVVLAHQGRVHAAEASYNNHWGVPLTLARMPVDTDFAIIEIGMSHPGEIAPLAKIAAPNVAMITNVAAAHLEAFDDISGIAHEKAAIFSGLVHGGTAIINVDLETSKILWDATPEKKVGFGTDTSADFFLEEVKLSDNVTVISATLNGEPALFKLSTAGRHFAMNAVGVLACVQAVGADIGLAACDLAQWRPPLGRGTRETIYLDRYADEVSLELIDDAFNANPTSLAAALEVLAAAKPRNDVGRVRIGRRMAILGDMLELGDDAIEQHRKIATLESVAQIDKIHCVGPMMRALFDEIPDQKRGLWVATSQELVAKAKDLIDAGDVILVKGSKGSKTALVVDAIRKLGHPAPTLE
ncbi:UDP-N-acetylmuramoyl-tripeptide--D-alanyl-D-alanine ligase [Falsihalocynthiibacter sp. S25ZX9]|uniref:UDP-N-acetylmuramoyl-tripeptide--D-alanyl-D- alanine ligase n=1 Tax=Falsihalocynthiibacter sp. S25ZX9 TaxID=3240870 RepID=UPI0035101083